jgi:ribose 5-phosphate isomerase
MSENLSPIDTAKFVAAKRAMEFIEDGMKLGLGTGSTAAWMVRCLGERVRDEGLNITGVPTSSRTAELARQQGIKVISLDEARWLDLTIDGADEFDPELNLIKGGGGALLQEKIVATASDRMIVITDISKQVDALGAFPLPVEVIPFGWQTTKALVEEVLTSMDVMGHTTTLRTRAITSLICISSGSAMPANWRSCLIRCLVWLKTGSSWISVMWLSLVMGMGALRPAISMRARAKKIRSSLSTATICSRISLRRAFTSPTALK